MMTTMSPMTMMIVIMMVAESMLKFKITFMLMMVSRKMFRTEPVIVIVLTTGSGAFVELQCSSHVSAANGKRKFSGQVTSAGLQ